jgi:PAS domain S-box-containing protein
MSASADTLLPPPSSLVADAALLANAIAEATDDVVFAKDVEGRYQYANPATLAVLGRPREQVLGRNDLELMPDAETARRLMANDARVLASGQPHEDEEVVPDPSGRLVYYSVRKVPLRSGDGRVIGLLGIARDVTLRKQAQADREAATLKLQMAIKAAGLVTAEIDYRTNLNHISAELAQLLELGDTDMTVPRQAIFDRIHPEDRERYLQGIRQTMDPTGTGHLAIDVRALLPSGTERWLHIRLQILFARVDGRLVPERGICAARDVTAEIVAQRQLRAAVSEVVEADRRKDEFIATLAHELRNPLAPIRNGLEIMKRTGGLPPTAVRMRDMMERQLVHLVRLVDDLLDVSRITRDKLDLRLEPLTVQRVVEHAMEACQPAIEAAGHTLTVAIPTEPLHVHGDLTRLAQVVGNLVSNATKYTPAGGCIELSARQEGDRVEIRVSDNGIGIAPDMLPHVFELFTQDDEAGSRAGGGLGIGLWLVEKLVKLHNGCVQASSTGLGQGSTFSVWLPAAR